MTDRGLMNIQYTIHYMEGKITKHATVKAFLIIAPMGLGVTPGS